MSSLTLLYGIDETELYGSGDALSRNGLGLSRSLASRAPPTRNRWSIPTETSALVVAAHFALTRKGLTVVLKLDAKRTTFPLLRALFREGEQRTVLTIR